MNYFKFLVRIVIFVLLVSNVAFPQTILKRSKKYVIININETFGLKVNDQAYVYKKSITDKIQNVGTVKIMLFKKGKCIGQILTENPKFPIDAGDFISVEKNLANKKEKPIPTEKSAPPANHLFSYLSFGAGIVASGLGYYLHNQANQTYADYKATTSPSDAVKLYDDTIRLDKQSQISFGVGGGLIALGIISYLLNPGNPQSKSPNIFSIQPVQKSNVIGLSMSWCFNHPSKRLVY